MPARCDSLQDEPGFLKVLGLLALPEFVGCKAVAVGWEGLFHWLESVR